MTLIVTVFVDLLTGVAVGLIAAGMAHALQLERLELDNVVSVPLLDRMFFDGLEAGARADRFDARVGVVALTGRFTVASSHKLVEVIGADIKGHEVVVFDLSGASYVDLSAAQVIGQLIVVAEEARTSCIVNGPHRLSRRDPRFARHSSNPSEEPHRGYDGTGAAARQRTPASKPQSQTQITALKPTQ